jgi:hypothetical protein
VGGVLNRLVSIIYFYEAFQNQTSKYRGVSLNIASNKWVAKLQNKNIYYGGIFDNEEDAAMRVNLLCDECKIERKNPMINAMISPKKRKREKIIVPDYGKKTHIFQDETTVIQ